MRTAICVFAFAAAVVHAGSAQEPRRTQPDSLPRELVEALLRSSVSVYPNSAEFTVGAIPAPLQPYLYVPRDARVLGGIMTGGNIVAALTSRLTQSQVTTEFQRELPRLGWISATNTIGATWGFVPAAGANISGSGLEFCHMGQSLQILPAPIPGGTQIVAVVQNYGGRCSYASVRAAAPATRPMLPTLYNPVGTTMNVAPCTPQPFIGGSAITERVQTTLTPAQLIESFASQLSDSGWKSPEVSAASRTWTMPDTAGMTRQLILAASPGSNGCVEVTMTVRSIRGR